MGLEGVQGTVFRVVKREGSVERVAPRNISVKSQTSGSASSAPMKGEGEYGR